MKKLAIQLILSLLAIAIVLYVADVGKVAEVLAGANPLYFLVSVVFYFLINVAMAWRIGIILEYLGTKVEYSKLLTSHFSGMLASDFTPARAGYFTTAFVLAKNHGVNMHKALVAILGPQMFDFIYKLGAGGIAAWYISTYLFAGEGGAGTSIIIGLGVLFAMTTFMWLILFSKRFVGLFSFIEKFPGGKHIYEAISSMQENSHAIAALTPHILILMFITWGLKGTEWWFVAMGLGIRPDIDFPPVIFWAFVQPIVTLLQFMPLPTIAGVGVSEAGAAFVLMLFGVSVPEAVAFTLMTRSIMIVVDSIGIKEGLDWISGNGNNKKEKRAESA